MAGTNILVLYGEGEREREQLQLDLRAVCAEAGKPIEELSTDDVLERVNKRRSRRRGKPHARRPLTERRIGSVDAATVDRAVWRSSHDSADITDLGTEVRRSFPNLSWTSAEVTRDKHRTYSICDAVAEVLREELPRQGRGERNRPWIGTVERAWRG